MTTALIGFTSTEDRLRTVLRVDALVTAAVGVLALGTPSSWFPGWLSTTVGIVLIVTGLELGLLSRAGGKVLRIGSTISAELAFAWVLATVVVLGERDLPSKGVEALGLVGLITLGFGLSYTRLVRRL